MKMTTSGDLLVVFSAMDGHANGAHRRQTDEMNERHRHDKDWAMLVLLPEDFGTCMVETLDREWNGAWLEKDAALRRLNAAENADVDTWNYFAFFNNSFIRAGMVEEMEKQPAIVVKPVPAGVFAWRPWNPHRVAFLHPRDMSAHERLDEIGSFEERFRRLVHDQRLPPRSVSQEETR